MNVNFCLLKNLFASNGELLVKETVNEPLDLKSNRDYSEEKSENLVSQDLKDTTEIAQFFADVCGESLL